MRVRVQEVREEGGVIVADLHGGGEIGEVLVVVIFSFIGDTNVRSCCIVAAVLLLLDLLGGVHDGLASLLAFHLRKLFALVVVIVAESAFFTSDTSSRPPLAARECGSRSMMWMVSRPLAAKPSLTSSLIISATTWPLKSKREVHEQRARPTVGPQLLLHRAQSACGQADLKHPSLQVGVCDVKEHRCLLGLATRLVRHIVAQHREVRALW